MGWPRPNPRAICGPGLPRAWTRSIAGAPAATGLAGLAGLRLGYLVRNRSSLASVMAVAVVVLVVGLSLFSQGPLFAPVAAPSGTTNFAVVSAAPSSGAQTGLTVVGGNSYWVARRERRVSDQRRHRPLHGIAR